MDRKPDLWATVAIAQSIVDRALAGRTVATTSKIHGGEIAAVFEIAFIGRQPSVVLKVYPQSLHWKMQKEATVIALIQDRLSVPVPRILLVDDTKQLLDLNFILTTKLDGVMLRSIEQTLTPDQFASAYQQIGSLLREFHRIPMDAFGYIGPSGIWTAYTSNQAYLTSQFDRKIKEFLQRGGAETLARRIAEHAANRRYLLDECSQPVLCHNDLHAGNLLASKRSGTAQLCGVLDFEGALAGDPLMDVAKALYYLGADARRALLRGYGDMGRTRWSEALNFYHLYFVLELWCWMAQIGNKEPLDKLVRDLERYSTE